MPADVEHITESGSDDADKSDLDILTPDDDKDTDTDTDTGDDTSTDTDTDTDTDQTTDDDSADEGDDDSPDDDADADADDEGDDDDVPEDLDDDEKDLDNFVKAQTPEYKEIIKKYPKFFKEFPGMRHTIFRMKAMDRIFSSVDEAKQTVTKHDDLLQLEDAVINAEPDKVLRGLKNIKPEAVDQWADKFLPTLYKEHRETHDRITTNLLATALRVAETAARQQNNKNLYNSVGHLSQYLFGAEQPPEPKTTKPSPELEREREALNAERQEFFESQARDFSADVMSTGERLLRKEITRNLDPDNALPAFVRKSIVDNAYAEVGQALDKDEKHSQSMTELWQRANRSRYSKDAKAKLVAAYLSRAKQLVGPIKRRLVKEAVGEAADKKGRSNKRDRRPYVRSKGKTRENPDWHPKSAKDVDWNRTSDLDILEGRAKPRRR
jgi:hypothetical protein